METYTTRNRVTVFLYELMRDHLVPGTVEKMVRECEKEQEYWLSNGLLGKYAEELAERLGGPEEIAKRIGHQLSAEALWVPPSENHMLVARLGRGWDTGESPMGANSIEMPTPPAFRHELIFEPGDLWILDKEPEEPVLLLWENEDGTRDLVADYGRGQERRRYLPCPLKELWMEELSRFIDEARKRELQPMIIRGSGSRIALVAKKSWPDEFLRPKGE